MNSSVAFAKIGALNFPLFKTHDVSALLRMQTDATSKLLDRLCQAQLIKKLMRGVWSLPHADPLLMPEFLTLPYPSYVSLQSALFIHGVISQIPEKIYAVTLDRTKQIKTPLATLSFHHIDARFFFGFELKGFQQIKIATKEKALLDALYLTSAKSKLFTHLPELDLGGFNKTQLKKWLKKIQDKKRRSLVKKRLEEIFSKSFS